MVKHSYLVLRFNHSFLHLHIVPEATRTRKLLLSRRELEKLMGAVNQKVIRAFH